MCSVCFVVGTTVHRVEEKKRRKSLSVNGKDRQQEGPSLYCQVEESCLVGSSDPGRAFACGVEGIEFYPADSGIPSALSLARMGHRAVWHRGRGLCGWEACCAAQAPTLVSPLSGQTSPSTMPSLGWG